ncbi:glycosyl transferase family 1 [Candidatus Falkowbacteria bacterium HGW-Falkowbacteria-1]|jgi:glycosyltransferase involved in cell wall biosynthesis|uniref:Glycosyl transferase family 1 n=1 Tax=Candidatus Falkowbacteria bacterium HGW-Falkowbacteria-1 TaxID=2013768 RepID=A0A2N2E9I2_9BACT|nr:MAG: glycosyl transferase family 1 [Candidatus Falkowbacteria bacterium HGW-Falkowbacteria-1]
MKIFFIGQKGIPASGGGVENHVENLALNLVKSGHEVFAYTRYNYSDKNVKEYKNIQLIPLPSIPGKNLDAISHTFLACLDFIFKRKADIVHFHSIGPASLSWLIKVFRPKTKIIFTFHSQCYYNTKWGKLAKFYLMLGERIGCKIADEVIVVSKNLKEYTENKYKRKVNYIPNGANPIEILPNGEITKKWNLEKNTYILSVSRVVRNKGLEYLIEAYKQIKTDKKLVIVGDGDFLNKLKEKAKNNTNVIFTGNQNGKVLNELFSNAALFVQASEAEGLSIALLEAMSAKIPIITSDIAANKEVVGSDAFLFENKNIDDLKNKINIVLSEENRAGIDKNIKNSYNKVLKDYDWENITKEVLDVYFP